MKKAILYAIVITIISFLSNRFVNGQEPSVALYYGFAFGLAWGMAFFLDRPDYSLPKKLGISFIGIGLLLGIGFLFFNPMIAIPSVLRFSIVFVAYFLLASFRSSKSLRK
ncbi:hypothetical protein PG637_01595 [Riemerella anatipestifer]|uniref:hypothetical protein n=1 Tax=Riemerella anatipestifer TaxID=34085 RepID=UPI00129DA87E|nr:hypothetical protein [Riemerella anatipestifer]MDY3318100.1 hypothetical protein [Riemerella anatipestifer]MDY3324363.1 hypothetical protein [Riemerella anatipestifer]MDY3353178.1 hypothetical protein [Riemerella anatipestifer]MRM83015.1 hypothetical protein [Riemerella anatipestifer]